MARLEDVLMEGDVAGVHALSREELERLLWKYRGLRKQVERDKR